MRFLPEKVKNVRFSYQMQQGHTSQVRSNVVAVRHIEIKYILTQFYILNNYHYFFFFIPIPFNVILSIEPSIHQCTIIIINERKTDNEK